MDDRGPVQRINMSAGFQQKGAQYFTMCACKIKFETKIQRLDKKYFKIGIYIAWNVKEDIRMSS